MRLTNRDNAFSDDMDDSTKAAEVPARTIAEPVSLAKVKKLVHHSDTQPRSHKGHFDGPPNPDRTE
jgi:hypothetical protein